MNCRVERDWSEWESNQGSFLFGPWPALLVSGAFKGSAGFHISTDINCFGGASTYHRASWGTVSDPPAMQRKLRSIRKVTSLSSSVSPQVFILIRKVCSISIIWWPIYRILGEDETGFGSLLFATGSCWERLLIFRWEYIEGGMRNSAIDGGLYVVIVMEKFLFLIKRSNIWNIARIIPRCGAILLFLYAMQTCDMAAIV